MTFPDPKSLEHWLVTHSIDTSLWGKGQAKSVLDLWLEIENSETTLEESTQPAATLLRRVQVVELRIERGHQLLLEAEQELANGEYRQRNHLPAEKIKPGETPLDAARRCLIEEMAMREDDLVEVTIEVNTSREAVRLSPSYPGLSSHYLIFQATILDLHLPNVDFLTPNRAHAEGDPVKAHHWRWVDKVMFDERK